MKMVGCWRPSSSSGPSAPDFRHRMLVVLLLPCGKLPCSLLGVRILQSLLVSTSKCALDSTHRLDVFDFDLQDSRGPQGKTSQQASSRGGSSTGVSVMHATCLPQPHFCLALGACTAVA